MANRNKQIWNGEVEMTDDKNKNKLSVEEFLATLPPLQEKGIIESFSDKKDLGGGMYQIDIKYSLSPKNVHLIYQDIRSGDKDGDDRHRFQLKHVDFKVNESYIYVGGYKIGDQGYILVAILTKVREINQPANISSKWIEWNELYKTFEQGKNIWSVKQTTFIACTQDNIDFLHNSILTRSLDEYLPQHIKTSNNYPIVQRILYGSPGTGKSHRAKEITADKLVFRTTFHPDTDYSSFVGSYKPVPKQGNSDIITYKFEEQIFTKCYCQAWKYWLDETEQKKQVCLLIEEINRGNCAQIFGDLFQLLDRTKNGFSEYSLIASNDLQKYLLDFFGEDFENYYKTIRENSDKTDEGKTLIADWDSSTSSNNEMRLCLPPNLSIVCTMNTSDQSLFPMDSAFKRRWDWEFIPIDYDLEQSSFVIVIDEGHKYYWLDFLKTINEKIYLHTKSEDKQMGNFFVKGDASMEVDCEQFVSKVMYFLWSEICKDNPKAKNEIFLSKQTGEDENGEVINNFSFSDLFLSKRNGLLIGFMKNMGIENISNQVGYIDPLETMGEDDNQKGEHEVYIDNLINFINNSQGGSFIKFKQMFNQDYKRHDNAFVVNNRDHSPNSWIILSRNKDVNVLSFSHRDHELMSEIYNKYGDKINDELGIPKNVSNKRNESRWMFSDNQAQAKLTTPHVLKQEVEFIWFVENAVKMSTYFSKILTQSRDDNSL